MNKLSTILFGIAFFVFATFTGTSAFAAGTDCKSIGETVYKGDPRYLSRLDTDADGAICEKVTITVPVVGGTPANGSPNAPTNPNGTGVYGPASPGQVDANGNPVKLDSNGNPIKVDANGNPVDENGNPINAEKNLANTGMDPFLIWAGVGLVALGLGLFYTFRKMRTAN